MEFLRAVLGDGFAAFETAIKAFNEANKDNVVKLANLSTGEYVGKDKYSTLETEANGYKTQLSDLNKQIESLKKETGTSEELKAKVKEIQDKYTADTKNP